MTKTWDMSQFGLAHAWKDVHANHQNMRHVTIWSMGGTMELGPKLVIFGPKKSGWQYWLLWEGAPHWHDNGDGCTVISTLCNRARASLKNLDLMGWVWICKSFWLRLDLKHIGAEFRFETPSLVCPPLGWGQVCRRKEKQFGEGFPL